MSIYILTEQFNSVDDNFAGTSILSIHNTLEDALQAGTNHVNKILETTKTLRPYVKMYSIDEDDNYDLETYNEQHDIVHSFRLVNDRDDSVVLNIFKRDFNKDYNNSSDLLTMITNGNFK